MGVFGSSATQATLSSASAKGESLLRSCQPIPDPTRRASSVCTLTETTASGSEAVSSWQKKPGGSSPLQMSPTSRRVQWCMPSHGTPGATYGSRYGEGTKAEESCDCETVIGPIFATVFIFHNTAAAFCTGTRWGGFAWDLRVGDSQSMTTKSDPSSLRGVDFPATECCP